MIRYSPDGAEVDPFEYQSSLAREADGRPWIMSNFVTTIDGAAVVDGGSTAINDDDDKAMFLAMRAMADFIVVGAGTVRAEDYGPTRAYHGQKAPYLVVVSGSLSLDPDAKVFSDPDCRVTILTGDEPDQTKYENLSEVADVIKLHDLSAKGIAHYLRMTGTVLIEGGPSLFGQFVAAGLVDEMAWTVAPLAAAGDSPRMAHGPPASPPVEMKLDRTLHGDRSLFLRYVRS